MTPREDCALSACGAALANNVESGDVLETPWPATVIGHANYTLRARGLRIVQKLVPVLFDGEEQELMLGRWVVRDITLTGEGQ